MSNQNETEPSAIAIVFVAIPVEYAAVIPHLRDLEEFDAPDGQTYEFGYVDTPDSTWKVIVVETGDGNNKAAAYVAKCIAEFKPDVTIFCGIAGGVKDVRLGDVVVGTTIYFYDRIKEDDVTRARPTDTIQANEKLLQKARHVARLHARSADLAYQVFLKPIATGGALVANPKSKVAELIANNYNDSLAVETEGSGYMMSAHIFATPGIVIRAASDLLANKAATDRAGWQRNAAENAADFTFRLLKRLPAPARAAADHAVIGWDEAVHTLTPLNREIEAKFKPDLVVTMSGPGSWAAFYCMSLRNRNIPVICAITFPFSEEKSTSYRAFRNALVQGQWIELRTPTWLIHLPDVFQNLPVETKILLFDDRIVTGASQKQLKHLLRDRGFSEIRTAALFVSGNAKSKQSPLDYVGHRVGPEFTMPWGTKHGRI
jgi:nucleoside phosphorylase